MSCGVGGDAPGPSAKILAGFLRGRWSIAAVAGIATIFCRSRDDPAAANPATPLLTLHWTFSAKRASVAVTDSGPDGSLLSPASARGPSRGVRRRYLSDRGKAVAARMPLLHWRDDALHEHFRLTAAKLSSVPVRVHRPRRAIGASAILQVQPL